MFCRCFMEPTMTKDLISINTRSLWFSECFKLKNLVDLSEPTPQRPLSAASVSGCLSSKINLSINVEWNNFWQNYFIAMLCKTNSVFKLCSVQPPFSDIDNSNDCSARIKKKKLNIVFGVINFTVRLFLKPFLINHSRLWFDFGKVSYLGLTLSHHVRLWRKN